MTGRKASGGALRRGVGTGILLFAFLVQASPAAAYVGPGAGFAFVSTFFVFFIAFILAIATLLTWPFRRLAALLFRKRRKGRSDVRRVVVLGFDGQDPELTERFMEEGILPNFSRLREKGAYRRLATTVPAESPVAWSTFMTGCNPGKHRIYDFLVPNRRSMIPELSSSSVAPPARTMKIGRYLIPLSRPRVTAARRGKTFWKILGEHGVFSTVLRVPLTFPPEKFNGLLLSAMCVPDLKGSQGTFFYYTSDPADQRTLTSGIRLPLAVAGKEARGLISGPENTLDAGGGELEVPFTVLLDAGGAGGTLVIDSKRYPLRRGEHTPWVTVTFRPGLGMKVRGICRFLLLESDPHVRLYMTPLHIDPERPAIPLSHPFTYSVYLAKTQGPYATLGVAEDTSGLNEGVIDGGAFLDQCTSIHEEREKMFFDALHKTDRGALVCVFDLTDRVQHMFFRSHEEGRPAHGVTGDPVRDAYRKMDDLLGRVTGRIDERTVLMVLSDHGFKSFRRGVNLNAWLRREGYLARKAGEESGDMLRTVEWSATRAYAVGFGGIFLNVRGREAKGIVEPGEEAEALKREITAGLLALTDPVDGTLAVKKVFDGRETYSGPYAEEGPDLVAGFRVGYRAAWGSVTGGVGGEVFEENDRPWGGDHNMNPEDVPGIFLCNRKIAAEEPAIGDIAPTVLELFGVTVPGHMDGRSFTVDGSESGGREEEAS